MSETDTTGPADESTGQHSATTASADPKPTHRWRGIVGVALLSGVAGVVASRPDLLLLAGVGMVFAAYPWITPLPEPALTVDRRVSESRPRPDSTVEVTVTLRNDGDRTLHDLRVIDGVPPGLGVVEGSPRRGCVLRPGETDTFSYSVETAVGCHRFEPATVIVRDLSGSRELETTAPVEMDIRCLKSMEPPALRQDALQYLGRLSSRRGGTGLEFHTLREYLPGDPARRISWAQYARTGEPATVDFMREQRTSVVLVVDARCAAYRGRPGEAHAVQVSIDAADAVASTLLDAGNPVGIGTVGRQMSWLAPGTGSNHRIDIRRLLTTDPALAPTPAESETPVDNQFRQLCTRLNGDCQVLVLSPLLDDDIVSFVCKLDSVGVPVSVLSPDVTSAATPGQRIAGIERVNRIKRVRSDRIPVFDWDAATSLPKALARKRRVVA